MKKTKQREVNNGRGMDRRSFLRTAFLGTSAVAATSLMGEWRAEAADPDLVVAIPNDPFTFDPINSANHDAMVVSQTIFENLIEVDHDGNLRPQLALGLPRISRDGLTYTFDLRDDVYFQDGQKFSAEDVKYSFEYVLDAKNKALRRPLFNRIKNVIVESPTRVRFELTERYRPWMNYLTKYMGIFPKGSREKHGDLFFKNSPIGVGTGPGIFVEWRHNDYVKLKKNPNYWRKGVPRWDNLVVKIIPEDSVRAAYLLTGQADIISSPPPKDFVGLKTMPGVVGSSRACMGGWFYLMTNTKKPPFDDVNFRKAVSQGIDRKVLADNVYYGMVDPCAIPAPSRGWWFSRKANDLNDFDLEKAKAHLKRSKYPNGAEFELAVPAQPYLIDTKDAAIVIQSQLAQLNIHPKINLVDKPILDKMLLAGNHTSILWVWMSPGEPTYMIEMLYSRRGAQWGGSGWVNAEFEKTVQESLEETDQEKLKPIYDRMLTILAEESPHVWMGFVHAANLWRDNVKNFQVNQGLTMRVKETFKG